jgi:hypothetical protein
MTAFNTIATMHMDAMGGGYDEEIVHDEVQAATMAVATVVVSVAVALAAAVRLLMLRNGKPPFTYILQGMARDLGGLSDGEGKADAADDAAAAPDAAHPAPDAEAPLPPLVGEADNAPCNLDDGMAEHVRIICEQAAAELDDCANDYRCFV